MNEWGIPDWRNPATYGDILLWSDMRWRWEFRRRLDDFRQEADKLMQSERQARLALDTFQQVRSSQNREAYSHALDDLQRLREAHWKKWGYANDKGCLDPRLSDYDDDMLLTFPHKGVSAMLGSASSEAGNSGVFPSIGQLTLTFNLDQPLSKNLEHAERILRQEQKEYLDRVIHKSHDPHSAEAKAHSWLNYLRILDGKEAMRRKIFGAPKTWADIAAVIYPRNEGAVDRVRKAHPRALKVARNFP